MDFWWDTVFCLHSRVSYPCLAIFPIEVSQQCEKHGRKYRENRRGVERESLHLTDGNILAALDALPAQFREALLVVDVEEFSYKEASEILQVPIGTIMSRLNRARGLLRNQLTDVARSYGISAGA